MAQPGSGRGLALGAGSRLPLPRHDLQGDVEPCLLVAGEPDGARAARSERFQRAVSIEDETGAFEGECSIRHGPTGLAAGGSFPLPPKPEVQSLLPMSTYDDDDAPFDFFDEPETVEATPRRRLPRLERGAGRRSGGDGGDD